MNGDEVVVSGVVDSERQWRKLATAIGDRDDVRLEASTRDANFLAGEEFLLSNAVPWELRRISRASAEVRGFAVNESVAGPVLAALRDKLVGFSLKPVLVTWDRFSDKVFDLAVLADFGQTRFIPRDFKIEANPPPTRSQLRSWQSFVDNVSD